MRSKKPLAPIIFLALLPTTTVRAQENQSSFNIELEGGVVWQSRNDVQIPNDNSATRFSLVDLVGSGPWPAARVYLTWNISSRHGLRALAAPLQYTESGTFADTVRFAGGTFDPGSTTSATYKFNSFRLTYRYRLLNKTRWRGWIGLTAKIRDARVALEQGSTAAEDTDVGFVPLLHLAAHYLVTDRWRILLDVDALAGGPGRAEDVALKAAYDLSERWQLTVGYRTVEGGADVDAVYNFAWFHYAVASVAFHF